MPYAPVTPAVSPQVRRKRGEGAQHGRGRNEVQRDQFRFAFTSAIPWAMRLSARLSNDARRDGLRRQGRWPARVDEVSESP
jgi:hypothetical protein